MTNQANTTPPSAILLVDDDPDIRTVVREALEYCLPSPVVCEVGTGEEALDFLYHRGAHANAPRPGLIYMDIEMPGMGGQAAVAEIRRDDDLADIPVVMMTAVTDDVQKRLAATNGANSYTVKPSTADELLQCVSQITEYWTRMHQLPHEGTSNA